MECHMPAEALAHASQAAQTHCHEGMGRQAPQ